MEIYRTTLVQIHKWHSLPLRYLAQILLIAAVTVAGCAQEEDVHAWDRLTSDPNVVLEHDTFGQVTAAKTYNDQGDLHGIVERYDVFGNVLSRKHFENGLEQGKARYFYPDGKLRVEIDYVSGLPHGQYRSYYKTGKVRRVKDFSQGLAVGTSSSYYPNGNVQAIESFKEGKLHGVIDYFRSDGSVFKRSTFIVGELVSNEYPDSNNDLGSVMAQGIDSNRDSPSSQ